MVVYICCFGGVTSCFFCRNLAKVGREDVYINHIDTIGKDYRQLQKQYRYVFAYGPLTYINEVQIKEYAMDRYIEEIIVCPQARYMIPSLQLVANKFQLPISTLAMSLFGCVDSNSALNELLDQLRRE